MLNDISEIQKEVKKANHQEVDRLLNKLRDEIKNDQIIEEKKSSVTEIIKKHTKPS